MSKLLIKSIALSEKKEYEKAFEYFKKAREELGEKKFDKGHSFKLIKVIFELFIKNMKNVNKDNKEWILYSLKNLRTKDTYFKTLIFKLVEIELKRKNTQYKKILELLRKIDVDYLSEESKLSKNGDGKAYNNSEKEKYFSYLSKCYECLGDLKKAKDVSLEALETITVFRNSNDVWFKRKIAKYFISEEKYNDAINIYKEISKKKNDWFILNEMADIYFKIGALEKAKKYMLEAILSCDQYHKKTILFLEYYNKFKLTDKELSIESLKVYFKIKVTLEKEITKEEEKLAEEHKIKLSKRFLEKISIKKFIIRCKKVRWETEPIHSGIVCYVDEEFFLIKEKNKNKYFCKHKHYPDNKVPIKGKELSFNLARSFDTKKNKSSFIAINLTFNEVTNITSKNNKYNKKSIKYNKKEVKTINLPKKKVNVASKQEIIVVQNKNTQKNNSSIKTETTVIQNKNNSNTNTNTKNKTKQVNNKNKNTIKKGTLNTQNKNNTTKIEIKPLTGKELTETIKKIVQPSVPQKSSTNTSKKGKKNKSTTKSYTPPVNQSIFEALKRALSNSSKKEEKLKNK